MESKRKDIEEKQVNILLTSGSEDRQAVIKVCHDLKEFQHGNGQILTVDSEESSEQMVNEWIELTVLPSLKLFGFCRELLFVNDGLNNYFIKFHYNNIISKCWGYISIFNYHFIRLIIVILMKKSFIKYS